MKERRALSPQPSCFLSGQEGSSRPSASVTGLAGSQDVPLGRGLTGGWQVKAWAPQQAPAPSSLWRSTQAEQSEFHNPTSCIWDRGGRTCRYEPRVGVRCQKTLFIKQVRPRDCLSMASVGISQLVPHSSTLRSPAAPSRPSPNAHKERRTGPALQRGKPSNQTPGLP